MEYKPMSTRLIELAFRTLQDIKQNGVSDGFIFFCLIAGMLCFIAFVGVRHQSRLRRAARALGDDFYVTGIPNNVWKKYARSFPEYKRLLHALAESGDFSPANVKLFTSSFSGTEDSDDDAYEIDIPKHDHIGTLGYPQIGHDQGYIHYSNHHHNE